MAENVINSIDWPSLGLIEIGVKSENIDGTVDKAAKDSDGQEIITTYIKELTTKDGVMTVTKGNGTTSTLEVGTKHEQGNSTNYGYVKLSDNFKTQEPNVDAANGIAASAKAVQDLYIDIAGDLVTGGEGVPTTHVDIDAATLGGHPVDYFAKAGEGGEIVGKVEPGTSEVAGSVKLSDTYKTKEADVAADNSVAASAQAVQDMYAELIDANKAINAVTLDGHEASYFATAESLAGATNAQTLESHPASDFALASDVSSITDTLGSTDISTIGDGTIKGAIAAMTENFQAGVDTIYNKIVEKGVTPSSKSPSDCATAIATAVENSYSEGKSGGYSSGKEAGLIAGIQEGRIEAMQGTAVASDVLEGKTFTNDSGIGNKGAMQNRGAWTGTTSGSGNVAIPMGYHNGKGYISGAGAYNAGRAQGITESRIGTATAAQVVAGYTFTNKSDSGLTGALTNNGAWKAYGDSGETIAIPEGYHNGQGAVIISGEKTGPESLKTGSSSFTAVAGQNYVVTVLDTTSSNGTVSSGATTLSRQQISKRIVFTTYYITTLIIRASSTTVTIKHDTSNNFIYAKI